MPGPALVNNAHTCRLPHSVKFGTDRFIAHRWPLFNAGILLILQNLDQPAFGSRISRGQKTNSNTNTFFEVWIFELRLTSLTLTLLLWVLKQDSYCTSSIQEFPVVRQSFKHDVEWMLGKNSLEWRTEYALEQWA